MQPITWDVVVNAILVLIAIIVVAILFRRTRRDVETAAAIAAKKVQEVKDNLKENVKAGGLQLAEIAEATGKVHKLLDAQILLTAVALRRLASLSGEPSDKLAADMADEACRVRKEDSNANGNESTL